MPSSFCLQLPEPEVAFSRTLKDTGTLTRSDLIGMGQKKRINEDYNHWDSPGRHGMLNRGGHDTKHGDSFAVCPPGDSPAPKPRLAT